MPVDTHISNIKIVNTVKGMLGVIVEGRLGFDFHVNALFKKASKKYHAQEC